MNPDLLADAGPLGPGVGELFQVLTAAPAPAELAGEQAALAMFRAHPQPAADPASGRARFGRPARRAVPGRLGRWGIRLAAASTLALSGGLAAAAYASALPAPVQHIAYRILGPIGVPDSHPHATSAPPSSVATGPAGGRHRGSAAVASPSPSSPGRGAPSASSSPAARPSAPVPAGADRLSASAAGSEITAGTAVVISGHLTSASGADIAGNVRLLERRAGKAGWRVAVSATSDSSGNVAVTVPALGVNAAFELLGPGGVTSPLVTVTVIPPVHAQLVVGPKGVHDALVVSTQYARRGNVVVLQKQAADGSWVYLRQQRLTAAGKARFLLNGRNLANESVRVVLLATPRHGESVSQPVTVTPPVG